MKNILLTASILLSAILYSQPHLLPSRAAVDGALAPFYHGVASGDPLTDRVILWTRITSLNPSETVGWQIATDTSFSTVVNSGSVTTDASSDYTVKVDATGLQANTWYYYRFSNNGIYSITGRTRTNPTGNVSNLRFAVVACSNYQSGFFNAYRDIVNKNDVDIVIHLGDYYYEYGYGDFDPGLDSSRLHESDTEVISLPLYRLRHSHYKLDPDLRTVHQQYPFITVWDDHESANDSWYGGSNNHDSTEGNWLDRKRDSRKAYFEWMPIRDTHNSVDTIHRTIPLGNLADLIMIDTRLEGREVQAGTTGATVTDTNRTMLGVEQLDWFKQQLSASTAKWKIIGNQVMIAPLVVPGLGALNQDQWDGYPAERAKILRHISSNNIDNMVVLTGDIHTSWANDIPHPDSTYVGSSGRGSAATEFVCTSVTSGSFITFSVPASIITAVIPHVKYVDLSKRGYLVLDVTDPKVQGDWIYMSTVISKTFTSSTAASWCDLDGDNHLTPCANALTPRGTNPPLAAIISDVKNVKNNDMVMIAIYPNPSVNEVAVQYYLYEPSDVTIQVTDMSGKAVYNRTINHSQNGLFNAGIDLSGLSSGAYVLSIVAGDKVYSKNILKTR